MDVQIKITADDKALEFSRNLSNFYANLVVSGFMADEKKETIVKVDKTANVEKEDDQDRPWETIEPDPIKVDEAPKEVEAPKEEPKEEETAASSHTVVEMRERATAYSAKHGSAAFKKILNKYGLIKLTAPGAEKHYDAIWEELEV